MSRAVLAMQVSLDGFVATLDDNLDWMWVNFDDELRDTLLAAVERTSTHVMGRHTYLAQAATWPTSPEYRRRADRVPTSQMIVSKLAPSCPDHEQDPVAMATYASRRTRTSAARPSSPCSRARSRSQLPLSLPAGTLAHHGELRHSSEITGDGCPLGRPADVSLGDQPDAH